MSNVATPIVIRIEFGLFTSGHSGIVETNAKRFERRLFGDSDCLSNTVEYGVDITWIGEEVWVQYGMMEWAAALQRQITFAAWVEQHRQHLKRSFILEWLENSVICFSRQTDSFACALSCNMKRFRLKLICSMFFSKKKLSFPSVDLQNSFPGIK